MSKIIVFDFDKTLSYSDTLFGFFCFSAKKNITYPFKIIFYIFIMFLTKFNMLSNTKLKHIGIFLFLKGMKKVQLKSLALNYSKKIKLNRIYKEFDFLSKHTIYVVSASFSDYLRPLFPENVNVLGSEFIIKENEVKGLKYNCFELEKAKILINKGITKIDLTYTDSFSDFSLACLSKKIIIVDGDKTFECNNIQDFKSYFNKN